MLIPVSVVFDMGPVNRLVYLEAVPSACVEVLMEVARLEQAKAWKNC